jgi:hypothetical protein
LATKKEKITKVTKTRRYRITKKNPRRARAIFKIDKGNVEQQTSIIYPKGVEIVDVEIPKEKNENLRTVHFSKMKICVYLEEKINVCSNKKRKLEKGYIYDSDGIFFSSFRLNDIKMLYHDIGAIMKEIKT